MTALLVSSRNLSCYFDCYYYRYFISSGDSAVLLKNREDISDSNKLQPGGQQLMDSIFGEDSDTDPENHSVRISSADLNTPIANNLPAFIPTTKEFATASLENNEKESPTSNSSRLDADALSIGRQLYIEYFILLIILILVFTY